MILTSLLAAMSAGQCPLPAGWDGVAARHPRYVIIGEMHGTVESPGFVADLACALSTRRERVLVALEQDATDEALQAAWRLPPDQFATAIVGAMPWRGEQDGRGSVAMKAMLVRLHALKAQGLPIAITAFDHDRGAAQVARFSDLPGFGAREAGQADNIQYAARRGNYDRVVVLVGNVHASKSVVKHRGASYEAMAMRLAAPNETVSLNGISGGGTTWGCRLKPGAKTGPGVPLRREDIGCGPQTERGYPAQLAGSRIVLGELPGPGSPGFKFDGYIWFDRFTASPPAGSE